MGLLCCSLLSMSRGSSFGFAGGNSSVAPRFWSTRAETFWETFVTTIFVIFSEISFIVLCWVPGRLPLYKCAILLMTDNGRCHKYGICNLGAG